jgi:alkaline phosphatase D
MKEVFLDFLDEKKDSTRRNRNGIYENYEINIGRRRLGLVLLDVRYNKDVENEDMVLF